MAMAWDNHKLCAWDGGGDSLGLLGLYNVILSRHDRGRTGD